MAKVSRKGFSPRKIVFKLNLNVHFLLFCCDAKKKKTEPKEEKTRALRPNRKTTFYAINPYTGYAPLGQGTLRSPKTPS